jgi:Terminase small subunit
MAKPVSQEARQRMSCAQRARHLTIKQEKFIKAYARTGNGTQSARLAGYSDSSDGVLKQQAVENLRKPAVKEALKRELARVELNFTPERVQRRLDEISHASQEAGQFGPAVRAEELLGKSIGMWIDQSIQLSDALNGSHVAALIEQARKRQQEPIDLADDGDGNWKQDSNDE